jgi:hypothetical protein
MINKSMNENVNEKHQQEQNPAEKKPNEHSGFYFSSFLKITDPETNEVLVEQRGDY